MRRVPVQMSNLGRGGEVTVCCLALSEGSGSCGGTLVALSDPAGVGDRAGPAISSLNVASARSGLPAASWASPRRRRLMQHSRARHMWLVRASAALARLDSFVGVTGRERQV